MKIFHFRLKFFAQNYNNLKVEGVFTIDWLIWYFLASSFKIGAE